jgi:hypothetical protein
VHFNPSACSYLGDGPFNQLLQRFQRGKSLLNPSRDGVSV